MHKVLLPIDGSEPSLEAAWLLAHLPHPDRLDLKVLSVVQRPFIHSSYATGELLEKAYEQDRVYAAQAYTKVAEMFEGANATLDHEISEGPVGEAIVDAAERFNADLVVVGAKGHSQIGRMLLGSVSDHVATHCPCSTLVVRQTGLKGSDKPIKVCMAYEGIDSAKAALGEISEIPWRSGTDFHVLTVATYLSDFIGVDGAAADAERTQRLESDLKLASEKLSEVAPHAKTHLIRSDHVGEGIVAFAEANNVDLLVVGESPRNAVNRFLLGSTSRYVLRHAPCSVWVTRNRTVRDARSGAESQQTVAG
ncbi:universal stress protein [Roseiconus nitratireducens]|uniref:Universal stress protein n=1 Tax=Roseiconus nitratireducens TaxID=2605748 RepID=A0A5M6DKH7_9BACT|nr:universal stress protein [Roseiconus nitratireducens]KAA5546876.1 universal stress protein [Roseiconus nitratireducens]